MNYIVDIISTSYVTNTQCHKYLLQLDLTFQIRQHYDIFPTKQRKH